MTLKPQVYSSLDREPNSTCPREDGVRVDDDILVAGADPVVSSASLPTGNLPNAGLRVPNPDIRDTGDVGTSDPSAVAFGPNDLQRLNRIHPWSQHNLCTKVCAGVSLFSVVLCTWGVMDYSSFWAQAEANKCRCNVSYFPSLPAYLFLFWLCLQMIGASVPFNIWLQRPILDMYTNQGRHITGTVIYRVPQEQDHRGRKSKFYQLVVSYTPDPMHPSVMYAKKMDVKRHEYEMSTLDIIVLPEIPTSAVLKASHDVRKGCRRTIILIVVLLVSPFLWLYLAHLTSYLGQFNHSNFWGGCGLWVIFSLSWVFSICCGYVIVVDMNVQMLHRGSQCTMDGEHSEESYSPMSIQENYMMNEEASEAEAEIV